MQCEDSTRKDDNVILNVSISKPTHHLIRIKLLTLPLIALHGISPPALLRSRGKKFNPQKNEEVIDFKTYHRDVLRSNIAIFTINLAKVPE